MVPLPSLTQRGIYSDLLRCFVTEGHKVYAVFPRERRMGKGTEAYDNEGAKFLAVKTLNLRKSSILEKGVGQILVERQFKQAVKKFWSNEKFDLILYSTPPITLTGAIKYLKRKNPNAKSYLLLKDIFPQNAVDIGMMTKNGLKGFLYSYFRRKEKKLYTISDFIGCMSSANMEYVLKHNIEVAPEKVEVAPNSVELTNKKDMNPLEKDEQRLKAQNEWLHIRRKYDIPTDRTVFIYGGNLGKPQGIDYLIKCLDMNKNRNDCYFIVVGTGTEFVKLSMWYDNNKGGNVKLMKGLPKEDYDMMLRTCDVGLIFLDHRFTIPNFPSRLLSYIEYEMPVICATDINTDMGRIVEENGFGYWCESVKPEDFTALVDKMLASDIKQMGQCGYDYLKTNYLVENTYKAIMKHF